MFNCWSDALSDLANRFDNGSNWGVTDCCQFVGAYWFLMTGEDHVSQFNYTDKKSAYRILKKHKDLFGLVRYLLGVPKSELISGDLVVIEQEGNQLVGVFNGSYLVGMTPEIGLSRFTVDNVLGAWTPCRKP